MKRTTEKPYLLAPAGSEEAFYAALAGGADAIYLGVQAFNARAFAKNFDYDTLARCIRDAHARGVKVYVTLNTLIYDREMEEAVETALTLWEMGVDAIICADVGLMRYMKAAGYDVVFHASTQLSIHSATGAEEVGDLGFEQVVVARELSQRDIATCVDAIEGATVEVFAHGALCVCYSGQCLFSSLVGGRSGNRGTCAQPCRLPYQNGEYRLSLKDLCLAEHIPTLIESGVACLKVEGRMKSPAYVGGVTRIYRRLLDENRRANKEEMEALAALFSRSGFTDGYFTGKKRGMLGIRREVDKQQSQEVGQVSLTPAKVPLKARCEIRANHGSSLTLWDLYGRKVTVVGEVPQVAQNQALTADSVASRLAKLGNTPYTLSQEDMEVVVEDGLFLTLGAINDLRRQGVEKLLDTTRVVNRQKGKVVDTTTPKTTAGLIRTALFMQGDVWDKLGEERGYFDLAFIPLWEIEKVKDTPKGVWMPPIIFDREEDGVKKALRKAKELGVEWALCGNPSQVKLARDAGLRVLGDFRLNVTNFQSYCYWHEHGVEDIILSPELTLPQLRDIDGRVITYGRIPLMITEGCYATTCTPDKCGTPCESGFALKDRMGAEFPILRVPSHRNMILNSVPTYLCDQREKMPREMREHFIFTTEDVDTCRKVISLAKQGEKLDAPHRRLPK